MANSEDFHFGFGPRWHGVWNAGTVERNRRIYDFELVYFSSGSARVLTRDAEFECSSGSVIIIPPGLIHCTVGVSRVERWCIHFDWYNDAPAHRLAPRIFVYETGDERFIDDWQATVPPGMHLPFFNPAPPGETAVLIGKIFSLGDERSTTAGLLRCGVMGTLLGVVLSAPLPPASAASPGPGGTFLRGKGEIDANFSDPGFRVTDAAAAAGVGLNQLGKRFRKILGISVHDYLLTRRIEHAADLLCRTALTIREIAFASGFNDPNYFTRLFRSRTGVTPSEYRSHPFHRHS